MSRVRTTAAAALTAILLPVPHARAAPAANMPVLGTVVAPASGSPASMTIAFDGDVFYFVDAVPLLLDRARIVDNGGRLVAQPLPPLPIPVAAERVTYDARHHALLLVASNQVARLDLTTNKVTSTVILAANDDASAGVGYDWSLDTFSVASGKGFAYLGRTGKVSHTCALTKKAADATSPAALAGSGNGITYVQTEDDQTIAALTPACRFTLMRHRTVSEAETEDDSIACDGVTFGVPAIWIRDSGTQTMTAYGLPTGACLLPTRLRLRVRSGLGCATLTRLETPTPLLGLAVRIGGASALTDVAGVACAAVPRAPGSHRVTAVFAGTRSWAASRASASYAIAFPPPRRRRVVVPPPVVHRRAVRAVPYVPPAAHVPGSVAPPPAAHPPAIQPGYAGSPVAQAAPFGVSVPQAAEEARLAYVASDTDAQGAPAGVELYAAALTATAAAGLRYRCRVSVVRSRGRP
jgi:hypothetical protein